MIKVSDIINYFDNTDEKFSEFTISDKIKEKVNQIDKNDIPSFAELIAFEFVDTKNDGTIEGGDFIGKSQDIN